MAEDTDVGLSPVESMAAGKPVISVAAGGLLEIVIDGDTGILLPPDLTATHIQAAVHTMTRLKALFMCKACEDQAVLWWGFPYCRY